MSNPSLYSLPIDSQGRLMSDKFQTRAASCELVGDLITLYSSMSRDLIQPHCTPGRDKECRCYGSVQHYEVCTSFQLCLCVCVCLCWLLQTDKQKLGFTLDTKDHTEYLQKKAEESQHNTTTDITFPRLFLETCIYVVVEHLSTAQPRKPLRLHPSGRTQTCDLLQTSRNNLSYVQWGASNW